MNSSIAVGVPPRPELKSLQDRAGHPGSSPCAGLNVRAVVDEFNRHFGYTFANPDRDTLGIMKQYAALRRKDIADKLEAVLALPAMVIRLLVLGAVLLAASGAQAQDKYFVALAQIESGDNDLAVGKAGEIGRFQCLKSEWRAATALPCSAGTNPMTALNVAGSIIQHRTHGQRLTAAQFAIAWHCPNTRHLNREQRDYVARFCNLVNQ